MITHQFSILLAFSLCGILIAQEEPNLENQTSQETAIENSSQTIELEGIFSKEPALRIFYDDLSPEEKDEFLLIVNKIKETLNQAFHDFADIAETHHEFIEKLKSFLGEEKFVLTIGLTKGSDTIPNQK